MLLVNLIKVKTNFLFNTIKGKGISFMENDPSWHSKKINKDNFEKILRKPKFNEKRST